MGFILAFIFTIFSGTLLPFVSTQDPKVAAAGIIEFCGDHLGLNMEPKPWANGDSFVAGDGYRQLTAQELFSKNHSFIVYQGETNPEDFDSWTEKEERDDEATLGPLENNGPDGREGAKSKKRAFETRTKGTCIGAATDGRVADFAFGLAKMINFTLLTFSTYAFSSGIVCDEASVDDQGMCVDLLFIVGGDGSDAETGLIGSFTDSIYIPLIVLVALLVAVWVFWSGIVQRKLREALWGFIWACLAVIVGLAFLLNPALLAKAPTAFTNTIAGCVFTAFGGNNCLGERTSNTNEIADSSEICVAEARGANAATHQMELIATSLNCSIWKAFILEPWSMATWGTNFDNLDLKSGTRGRELIDDANQLPETFCIQMGTDNPNIQSNGPVLLTGGPKICNLALYQLFISTDAELENGSETDIGGTRGFAANFVPLESDTKTVDHRWYNLVDVASANATAWTSWSGADGSGDKMAAATLALLTSFLGSIVIFVIAIFAMVFYFAAVFLMALAPLFFLIGVHPGKGRDILKGYAEMVLSNVFKYIASALFLVLTLALYAGVLGASSNSYFTFFLVVILSFALLMYRRELVDLIGTVNMGGTKMGQATTDRIKKLATDKGRDTKRLGSTMVGTAVGSKLAGGTLAHGAAEGFSRELKRSGGLLGSVGAGVSRGYDLAGSDKRKKLSQESNDLGKIAGQKDKLAKGAEAEADEAEKNYSTLADQFKANTEKLKNLEEQLKSTHSEQTVLEKMREGRPGLETGAVLSGKAQADASKFSDAVGLQRETQKIDRQLASTDSSDTRRIDELKALKASKAAERDKLLREMQYSGTYDELQGFYNEEYGSKVREFNQLSSDQRDARIALDEANQERNEKRIAATTARLEANEAKAVSDAHGDALRDIRPNKAVTSRDERKIEAITTAAGEEAVTEDKRKKAFEEGITGRRASEATPEFKDQELPELRKLGGGELWGEEDQPLDVPPPRPIPPKPGPSDNGPSKPPGLPRIPPEAQPKLADLFSDDEEDSGDSNTPPPNGGPAGGDEE